MHFEILYKNSDMMSQDKVQDYSFEIDNYNKLNVPKNIDEPFQNRDIVHLPDSEDLYRETHDSQGYPKW